MTVTKDGTMIWDGRTSEETVVKIMEILAEAGFMAAENVGQLPQYFVENSHSPIIPKEILLQVQAEIGRRKKERIRWGGLKRADELMEELENRMREIGTQTSTNVEPHAGAEQTLAGLQSQWAAAAEQRAEYADSLVKIRNLLERAEAVGGRRWKRKESTDGSCVTAEDFWKMTRTEYWKGAMTEFSDEDCGRFVEKIVPGETSIQVIFKAGITVEVARNGR